MCAPRERGLAECPGVSSASEMGMRLGTHHMATGMLVGCLTRRVQEAEDRKKDLQAELGTVWSRIDKLEEELQGFYQSKEEDLARDRREIRLELEHFYQGRLEQLQEALNRMSPGGTQRSSGSSRSALPQEE